MKAIRSVCACLLLAGGVVGADDLWNKEPGSWSKKDAEQILTSSPWGRRMATRMEYATQEGSSWLPNHVIVLWWSAHTPRRAFMRLFELSGGQTSKEQIEQFTESKGKAYRVALMEGGAMVAVSGRLSPEELKKAAWLFSPRLGRNIECEAVEVVMASGKPERIVFQFPKEVEGKPLITSEDKRLLFRWKLPESSKWPILNAQQREVTFEPQKMVARGKADF